MNNDVDGYADLLRRDRVLPGLRLLFDPDRLARVLEARTGVPISAVERVYVRYKPGTNCLTGYRVHGAMGASFVYAKALPRGAGHKLAKPVATAGADTWLGPRPLVLADEGIVVRAHPNDGKLRALARVADDAGRELLLRRAPEALRDPSLRFRALAYKPERRFVAALHRRDSDVPAAVVKMYTRSGYEHAVDRTRGIPSGQVLRVPRRIARDSRRHLIVLEWLPGRVAAAVALDAGAAASEASLAGQALAELHEQAVLPGSPRCTSYDLGALPRVLADVAFVYPALAGPLQQLRARLCGTPAPHALSPVHGDFHLRQVVVDGGRIGLVDFDRAGAGPAAGDLACSLSHLDRDVLAGVVDRERARDIAAGLLAGYQRIRPVPASLDLHRAAAIARLLPEPFRHCRPDSLGLTRRLLDRALSLASRSGAEMVASCR